MKKLLFSLLVLSFLIACFSNYNTYNNENMLLDNSKEIEIVGGGEPESEAGGAVRT